MIEATQHYGGYVVQSTGDGIFALFGAPVAHEDHPQRALYAAVRMQDELRRYGDKLQQEGLAPIEIRVGVNSGEVVVRSIRTGPAQVEYTPIGHTTNLAARLQAVARTGSIVVSENTRKLTEGYFQFRSLGGVHVKGIAEPINVYEVAGLGALRTRLQRAMGRGLTRFVGRARELETLKDALESVKAGRGQIVATVGEPGVGKSRLYYEFKAISQSGCMVLEAYSVSYGKASTYLPVIDLLRNYFDIAAGDDERKRREKVTGRVLALERNLEDTLPYLFSLLGIVEGDDPIEQMDSHLRKRRTIDALKRILLRESLNQPLIVMFEDLQWIDEQTQESLNLLADSIANARILLLVNYRPDYSHQWNSKTYYTQLRLDSLGDENAGKMLDALLFSPATAALSAGASRERSADDIDVGGRVRVQDDLATLKRLIIERTEGTPFFMEEMVQALFEDGVLQRNGVVTLAKPISVVKIPATVQAVLASRIDRLGTPEKELLQTLAVLGREFSWTLVQRVTSGSNDKLEQMLSHLQLSEFINEQPAVGDIEYSFKHALTQEVTYNSILSERRKAVHERAGEAIEKLFADRLDDYVTDLARHFDRAGNPGKAVEYLGWAGRQAMQRSAHAEAVSNLTGAIDLLQKMPLTEERLRQELKLQVTVGSAYIVLRGWGSPEAEKAFACARELSDRAGDTPDLFPGLFGLWAVQTSRGNVRISHELADQLLRIAQRAKDQALIMYAHIALTTNFMREMDRLYLAREHVQAALSLYDGNQQSQPAHRFAALDAGVWGPMLASILAWQLGYPDQALNHAQEMLDRARRLTDGDNRALAEASMGLINLWRGEASAAREATEIAISLCNDQSLDSLAQAKTARGSAMLVQGYVEEAIAEIHEALTTLRTIGTEVNLPFILCSLAEACLANERFNDGLEAMTEAQAIADKKGIHYCDAEISRGRGELLLRHDDSDIAAAQHCFEEAVKIARSQNARSWELRATMSLARLLAKQGRRDEARTMLAEIYNWFTEGFDTADLKEARALLAELSS